MTIIKRGIVITFAAVCTFPSRVSTAPPLLFDQELPVSVTLNEAAPVQAFTFPCTQDKVASVYAETIDGDLVVDASLLDPNGSPFVQGTQVSSNPNITIAEAFVMPATGECKLKLSRAGNTSGTLNLRLLSGYAHLTRWDAFDGARNNPLRMIWTPYADLSMDVRVLQDQRLRIQVIDENVMAYIAPDDEDLNLTDYYIQADFTIDATPTYFEYGFLLRASDELRSFYSVTFSSDGDYSIYYYDGEWNTVQDWTVSPLIDGTNQQPRVGVWVQGNTFRLYYNDRLVGEVTDADHYASQGTVGVAAATTLHQSGVLTVYADNAVITTPFQGH